MIPPAARPLNRYRVLLLADCVGGVRQHAAARFVQGTLAVDRRVRAQAAARGARQRLLAAA